MMNRKVLIVYKSITGFTREYAEMIAQETGGTLMESKKVTAKTMSDFDTVIYGSRIHAGTVDGLKNAKTLFGESRAAQFVVFATGATPNDAKDVIEEMWQRNFSPAEMSEIPHFYMQGGLRYEKMALIDKMMMKAFGAMMRKKKDKSEYEKQFEEAIAGSYDISSKEYIKPLILSLGQGI